MVGVVGQQVGLHTVIHDALRNDLLHPDEQLVAARLGDLVVELLVVEGHFDVVARLGALHEEVVDHPQLLELPVADPLDGKPRGHRLDAHAHLHNARQALAVLPEPAGHAAVVGALAGNPLEVGPLAALDVDHVDGLHHPVGFPRGRTPHAVHLTDFLFRGHLVAHSDVLFNDVILQVVDHLIDDRNPFDRFHRSHHLHHARRLPPSVPVLLSDNRKGTYPPPL